jgi:hypothetical protein
MGIDQRKVLDSDSTGVVGEYGRLRVDGKYLA